MTIAPLALTMMLALGLGETQVKQLEERDTRLQKQVAELREQLAAVASSGRAHAGRSEGKKDGSPPGARGRGGSAAPAPGGERAARDPAVRAAALQVQIDDADTAAWLAAEPLLDPPQRDRARAVAEAYREALADEREKLKAGR